MANLSKFCVSVGFGCKTRGVLSGVLLDNANVLLGNGEFCDVFIGWDFFCDKQMFGWRLFWWAVVWGLSEIFGRRRYIGWVYLCCYGVVLWISKGGGMKIASYV